MFTMENTEGFDQADLDVLNETADIIRSEFDVIGFEQYSIDYAIINCWSLVSPNARQLAGEVARMLCLYRL